MAGLLDILRLRSIFGDMFHPNNDNGPGIWENNGPSIWDNGPVMGNDLSSQGGITGNMPDPNDPTSFGMDMPDTGGIFGSGYQPTNNPPLAMGSNAAVAPPAPIMPTEDYSSPNFIGDIGGPSPQIDQPGFENSIPQLDLAGHARDNNIQDEYDQFMSLYKPEHQAQDRLDAMLASYPQHEKAGFARKLAATFAGLGGGVRAADEVLDEPFNRELSDWKNQINPILAAANAERGNNVNMRQITSSIMSQDMANRRLDRLQNRDTELRNEFGQKMDLSERRFEEKKHEFEEKLKISQAVARGGVFKVDDSGQAAFYFKDGSKIPVDATYMSAEENQKYAIERAEKVATARTTATEKAKRDRIVKTSIQDPDDPSKTIEGTINLETNEFTPAVVNTPKEGKPGEAPKPVARPAPKTGSTAQESGINRKLDEQTRASEFLKTHPGYRSWITTDKKTGITDITQPNITGGYIYGPTEDQYKEMMTAIKTPGKTTTIPIGGKGQTADITEKEIPSKYGNPPKPGLVHVTTPNGGGWATPEEAKQKGWRIDQ